MDFTFDNETLINIALAAAAVLFLIIVIFGINRVFKLIYKKIFSLAGDKIKGLSLKNYQFLSPEYTAKLIIGAFKTSYLVNCLLLLATTFV